ncbi:MAG: protein phosphatase 2C domain-containing protein [Actinomycetota bacterium]|nr:protein phosphatase 2C domain-containing protein [Actinomycetota bacterium]
MQVTWGEATDVGRVRRSNQDYLYTDGRLFVVADGMGGANGGEVASKLAVEGFVSRAVGALDGRTLKSAVAGANQDVFKEGQAHEELAGMGTTLVAAVVSDEPEAPRVLVLNVGDSRGYILHDSDLTQITEDHSWVGELLRAGKLSPQEAEVSASRHMLTRVVGVAGDLEPDMWEILPRPGDKILLCSDGITNELADPEISSILMSGADAKSMAEELVRRAVEAGGLDNATAVVIDFGPAGPEDAPAPLQMARTGLSVPRTMVPPAPVTVTRQSAPLRGPDLMQIPQPLSRSNFTKAGTVLRILAFLAALALVIGIGVYGITNYVRGSYFVGVSNNRVAIYQGRPGGLLWFAPHLVTVRDLRLSDLPSAYASELRSGVPEPSFAAASKYISNLQAQAKQFSQVGPGTTTTTTTTTTSGAG